MTSITQWALNECDGDESLTIDLLGVILKAMALELRSERARQSQGFVYRGRESMRPPKLPPPPLDGSGDRL